MPYNYEAAPASQSSRTRPARQATSTGSAPRMYPASGPSVAVTAEEEATLSTRERWAAAQAPTIQMPSSGRSKRVQFVDQSDPSSLQPQARHHRSDSPTSQASSVPSLSHSFDAEHDDDIKCPPTPEFKHRELAPEGRKSSRSAKSKSVLSPAQAAARSTINQIVHEFDEYVVAFQHPRDLDFEAPAAGSNATPALSYTAKNKPLLEHIQRLEGLQTELDGVSSHGLDEIRKARKDAVVSINNELEGLMRVRSRMWSKIAHEQSKQHPSRGH